MGEPVRQFKVLGPDTVNGALSMWHFPSLESASQFASFLATETHAKVMVLELIGTWQIRTAPVEFKSASENVPAPKPEAEILGAFVGPANPCEE